MNTQGVKGLILGISLLSMTCSTPSGDEGFRQLITCSEFICSTVLYDIDVNLHNYKMQFDVSNKDNIDLSILMTADSGGGIYYSLNKLVKEDSVNFHYLVNKYSLTSLEGFSENVRQYENFEVAVDSITNDIVKKCDCNIY